ncbi:MAG: hypothetical protein KA205_06185 [Acidobacteria bacterium]|nr:hypothetical protein [Acidobacteriota bacterium]
MTKRVVRSIGVAVFAMGCSLAIPQSAAAQTAPAPASLAGTWNMGLIGDHVIPVALVLEQKGTALKGTFIFMGKDYPVTGEINGSAFSLTGQGPGFGRGNDHAAGAAAAPAQVQGPERASPTNQTAEMTIRGTRNADDGLAGDMVTKLGDGRSGVIKWTAERLKERKVPAAAGAASAPANVAGNYTMTIPEAQLTMDVALKQDGAKVSGAAKSEHLGVMALDGTYAAGTIAFVMTGSMNGQDVRIEFTGKYTADGTLGGDLTSQMGQMTWAAQPIKK